MHLALGLWMSWRAVETGAQNYDEKGGADFRASEVSQWRKKVLAPELRLDQWADLHWLSNWFWVTETWGCIGMGEVSSVLCPADNRENVGKCLGILALCTWLVNVLKSCRNRCPWLCCKGLGCRLPRKWSVTMTKKSVGTRAETWSMSRFTLALQLILSDRNLRMYRHGRGVECVVSC